MVVYLDDQIAECQIVSRFSAADRAAHSRQTVGETQRTWCVVVFAAVEKSERKQDKSTISSTHWGRDKIADILQTILTLVQETTTGIGLDDSFVPNRQHTGHYFNQWWPSLLVNAYASLGFDERDVIYIVWLSQSLRVIYTAVSLKLWLHCCSWHANKFGYTIVMIHGHRCVLGLVPNKLYQYCTEYYGANWPCCITGSQNWSCCIMGPQCIKYKGAPPTTKPQDLHSRHLVSWRPEPWIYTPPLQLFG